MAPGLAKRPRSWQTALLASCKRWALSPLASRSDLALRSVPYARLRVVAGSVGACQTDRGRPRGEAPSPLRGWGR